MIFYVLGYLLICFIPTILLYLFTPILNNLMPETNAFSTGQFLAAGLFLLGLTVIQKLSAILMSIAVIMKSKNQHILSIYNNLKIPTIIFLVLILFDLALKTFFGEYLLYKTDYFEMNALSLNFIPIYLVAIINTIRLKIQKAKSL